MKISFVSTVFNEEENIVSFIESVLSQTKKPDEIIIVDGGSTDATVSVISNLKSQISNKKIKFKLIIKKGNRSLGRNEAIRNASNEIVVCSDAGCTLDRDWVKNITAPFNNSKVDVVAGYYKGEAKTIFQKCLIPYVLVMSDKIKADNFLPATRSMAIRKSIWKKVGGFPEKFSHNEYYVFAKSLKKNGAKIFFEKKAIVYWIPRKNLWETFRMFFRFALGDAEAGIYRQKVIFLFFRYAVGVVILLYYFRAQSFLLLGVIVMLVLAYLGWSIRKNYKYIKSPKAIFILPVLQLFSDWAVLMGSLLGLIGRLRFLKFRSLK